MLFTVQVFTLLVAVIFLLLVILALSTSFFVAVFAGGPFVPTPTKAVKKILEEAGVKRGDVLYDIGAGDGRFVHYATKLYGAKATGFEIDPFVYSLARFKQILLGWKGKMVCGNFQNHSLRDADIIICYMLPSTLEKYQAKFDKELKENTKVISYTFHIGSWKPIKEIRKNKKTGIKKIFIYRVKKAKKSITKKKIRSKA